MNALFDTPAGQMPTASEIRWGARKRQIDGMPIAAAAGIQYLRFTLSAAWRAGPSVLWIGMNPSAADAERTDPTAWQMVKFTNRWGYGRSVTVNLYPLVSSSPAQCRARYSGEGEWCFRNELYENEQAVLEEAGNAALIVACFGDLPHDKGHADRLIDAICDIGRDVFCLGKTRSGGPTHPLARGRARVPDDAKPKLYRLAR